MYFFEKVPLKRDQIISVIRQSSFDPGYPLHVHPEYEIILILNASGKRVVGNHISSFEGMDMAFLAPNLPHKWQIEKTQKQTYLLVLKFKEILLNNEIFYSEGCQAFNNFLQDAKLGLLYTKAEDILSCNRKLKKLIGLNGVDLVMASLEFIYKIYQIPNRKVLSTKSYSHNNPDFKLKMMENIYMHILDNFQEKLSIKTIAEKFNLSESGFCNYFKRHTGLVFSEFVNDLRISHACNLLLETSDSVASIGYNSGFANLSYFNRKFKEIKGISPREFRNRNDFQKTLLTEFPHSTKSVLPKSI